ncbi:hypothetical protein RchiOBHm_Chr2g0127781 [Rosa chinensis]|uniref:Uncharacterized protein n=1 Tax=Rosa chinensis TaxID=74649 RepID=A0A2P6RU82_ROSCH|nr:hypothetical protein RchiOBHm_Chr2g0127781 [Rosa chinensis]
MQSSVLVYSGDEKDRPTMRQVVQILEGVLDVSVSPIPQLLQRLTESIVEVTSRRPTSCSDLWSHDVSNVHAQQSGNY